MVAPSGGREGRCKWEGPRAASGAGSDLDMVVVSHVLPVQDVLSYTFVLGTGRVHSISQ